MRFMRPKLHVLTFYSLLINSKDVACHAGDMAFSTLRRDDGKSFLKNEHKKGRGRYSRDSVQIKHQQKELVNKESFNLVIPSDGSRIAFFTCRHTYEELLMQELRRNLGLSSEKMYSPYPGFVCVRDSSLLTNYYDPIYALQIIPDAIVVTGESIKDLTTKIITELTGPLNKEEQISEQALIRKTALRNAPRGSLSIHTIVPGMSKGQRNPVLLKRSQLISTELTEALRITFAAARKPTTAPNNDEEKWILQVLLISPNMLLTSMMQCKLVPSAKSLSYWPNWNHPLGLAPAHIEDVMPSSAYRKLMEAFSCMAVHPREDSLVFDLGASPGGWTALLRRMRCEVVAVDRSPLVPNLMSDSCVLFHQGDVFSFEPDNVILSQTRFKGSGASTWMVSDVVCYPDRIHDLLDRWCSRRWAQYMVVTMKFQGSGAFFDDIEKAIDIASKHSYICRAKHFFNNKNEITLMLSDMNM